MNHTQLYLLLRRALKKKTPFFGGYNTYIMSEEFGHPWLPMVIEYKDRLDHLNKGIQKPKYTKRYPWSRWPPLFLPQFFVRLIVNNREEKWRPWEQKR